MRLPTIIALVSCVALAALLACLDGERWIQASPWDGAVTIRHRTEPDPWFAVPVRLYRLRR